MTRPMTRGRASRSQRRRSRTAGTLVVAVLALGALALASCGTAEAGGRGDGLMWDASPAMQAAASAMGPSTVENDSYWGFALSSPEIRDWRALWPSYIADFQPTVVAITFGIHDT